MLKYGVFVVSYLFFLLLFYDIVGNFVGYILIVEVNDSLSVFNVSLRFLGIWMGSDNWILVRFLYCRFNG